MEASPLEIWHYAFAPSGRGTDVTESLSKPDSRRRPPETLKALSCVVRSDRRQPHRVARLDHGAVPDDHRDVAVPHGEIAGTQAARCHGCTHVLLLRQPRK